LLSVGSELGRKRWRFLVDLTFGATVTLGDFFALVPGPPSLVLCEHDTQMQPTANAKRQHGAWWQATSAARRDEIAMRGRFGSCRASRAIESIAYVA
jgi:hypothetical protein